MLIIEAEKVVLLHPELILLQKFTSENKWFLDMLMNYNFMLVYP